ncbi:MAG: glycyl-radical enzyme activating protein [Candidatus Eremiobacteraeota bacterium]|nr:glycyl-radical enzyme activating protein [Candidatus Eremiobacteraeota bacterium]
MKTKVPIFNIQTFATHDGPGIRTLVFFKGCPLRCTWCSNPEGQIPAPQIRRHSSRCTGCLECVDVCKYGMVSVIEDETGSHPHFNRDFCNKCKSRLCMENCPEEAIDFVGEFIGIDELFKILKKDIRLYWNSGGGVTFSGGEPLLYPDFIADLSKKLHSFSVKTAIETCGYWKWDDVKEAIDLCDTIFFDVKTLDDEKHVCFTGKSNKIIISNLKRLADESPEKIIISIPVIPGVNESVKDIEEIGRFALKNGINEIRLLPYHQLGIGKYKSLDMEYPHESWNGKIDPDKLNLIKEQLLSLGLKTTIEGQ